MKIPAVWCSVLVMGINTWLCHGQTAARPKTAPNPAAVFVEFCDVKANFIAEVEVYNADSKPERPKFTPSNLWVLGNLARLECDLSQSKGSALPPAAIADLKQSGLARSAFISRPDLRLSYVVFPDLKAYSVTTNGDHANPEARTVTRTELGRESVAGKECIKTRLTLTTENSEPRQALIWKANAEDIVPNQFQSTNENRLITLRFTSVRFATPDRKLFDVPPSFKKCDTMEELMILATSKRIGNTPPPQR